MIPSVIHKTYLAKLNNNNVTIWGDGKARREFMYAADLADFIYYAVVIVTILGIASYFKSKVLYGKSES